MSTRGSARADGRRNREAILKAAAEAMLDNPQASIAEVAERAGLTRATVYRHYADRDALLQAMARTTAMHLVPTILDEMRPLPWREAMEVLAARAISLSAAYRDVILSIAPTSSRRREWPCTTSRSWPTSRRGASAASSTRRARTRGSHCACAPSVWPRSVNSPSPRATRLS
ncbi:TetR/AcrR family transcriptional regulator [Nocardioides daphniae]|uniref:TetR/AcrR family transcriptional regulator n=1 Tax=Nocardioides daphniae TaxID=402297 RepID=A0A4P7UBE9_9ACTN|nr:TetR/AcrR family transcriptional regulator [Nocardioides daphniae]